MRAGGDATKSDVGDGYSTHPDRATGTDQNLATGESMSS
jgi:hypothetical protein